MNLKVFEENQILLYASSIILGAFCGYWFHEANNLFEYLIEPFLALMLYSMFCQIPFLDLLKSFSRKKFIIALLILNFIAVPIFVWLLTRFISNNPKILLGVYLCLLTPCVDYVIVFSKLGGGNSKLMLAMTPILLLVQICLLPIFLWIFLNTAEIDVVNSKPFFHAFMWLIALPLSLAFLTETFSNKYELGQKYTKLIAWLPIPTMMLTLFFVVASQIYKIHDYLSLIITVIPIYVVYMIIIPFIGIVIGSLFDLKKDEIKTLIFSGGTRNSLVVLPLAIALPETWRNPVIAIIVTQTIVELIGELLYIRIIPSIK